MSLISASRCRPARSTRSSGSNSSSRFEVARVLLQHLGDADDRVQRRAQLVAHVGEELRLVLARELERLFGTLPLDDAPELAAHIAP